MTDDNGTMPRSDAVTRLVEALSDPARLYDGGQLAFLMSTAGRWGHETGTDESAGSPLSYRAGFDAGYRAALAEMERDYPPPPYAIVAGIKIRGDQAAARAEADADRTQVYAGGPVPVWDEDRPDHVAPKNVSVRINTRGAHCEWADQ